MGEEEEGKRWKKETNKLEDEEGKEKQKSSEPFCCLFVFLAVFVSNVSL